MNIPDLKNMFDFMGKVALITGGGRGIGAGIAQRFAQAGAAVVVNYHSSAAGAQQIVKAIEQAGGQALAVQADVTRREDVQRMVKEVTGEYGRIDILINNAGLYPLTSVLEMTDDEWDAVVNSNLRSVFLCTQAVSRQMIAQGSGGAIVNIASIEAINPAPMHSHYDAAKGGVLMHTKTAAFELGPHNIRVNAVSPGLIWREGLDRDWPDGVERYRKAAPLGRLGRAEDVADACLFLASPASRWITGANLLVDGGVMTNRIY
ncbi:MAG: 3-oxoacyl-ACP reductase FabG [Anaerolineales bacterium]|nr:3-oxoacyl-ACP reductase FabG [Anaerolineales bacterium]